MIPLVVAIATMPVDLAAAPPPLRVHEAVR